MANLTETAQWETGIYRIETTDPVLGGEDGISNLQAKLLGNRTLYLKDVVDDHEDRVDILEASATNFNRMKGIGTLVKQGIVTAPLNLNVFGFVSTAKLNPSPIQNRVTVTAISTSPIIVSFSNGYDANGPIVYYGRVTATQEVLTGSNNSGLLYAELNATTGEVTFGLDTINTVAYATYADPATLASPAWDGQGYWYSLKDEKMYAWNGSAWVASLRVILGTVGWGGANGTFTRYGRVGVGIKEMFGRSQVPAGTVQAYAGATAPEGYVICDGSQLNRSLYSELFSIIGVTYGIGNGTTTFNLPDLRAEFIRGLDGGRGIDSGRALGSAQTQAIQSHDHSIWRGFNTATVLTSGADSTFGPNDSGDVEVKTTLTGGSETRPRNVAMNFIIKF
jgi:microcystin-dependent protein